MSCAVTWVKTQDASKQTHGKGIRVDDSRTHPRTVVETDYPERTTEQVTSYEATLEADRPSQILKEDPGLQVTWTYELTGDWPDLYDYPDPEITP